ncbi:MAG TPA: lysoplasmalogenase family protein [Ktedonobacterales bacterium]|nr:lysoplasmalogenase family protein [Ktedonobacterales bacterium]
MAAFANSWQAPALLALFALWAALLFGGFILGRPSADGGRRMPTWARMASSATLVLIAWLEFALTRQTSVAGYALFIAAGMSLDFLGDLFLAGVIAIPQPVLGGIAAFGLGHVAYLLAIIRLADLYGLNAQAPRWGMLALWLLIGLVGWYALVMRGQRPTMLHWAALPYALLLAGVAGLFTGVALQSPALVPAALGAILFLVSDLILASQLFAKRMFPLIGDLIWLTYGPGQALIVASVAVVSLAF